MKYSILLLGASISIALFIRICCAVKVNHLKDNGYSVFDPISDTNIEETAFSGRSEDVYKRILKSSILDDDLLDSRTPWLEQSVDELVEEISEIRKTPFRRKQNAAVPATGKSVRVTFPTYFDSDYCGQHNPPNISWPDCDTDSYHRFCVDPGDKFPEGCRYNETTQSVHCHDVTITNIPPLPPVPLNSFDLSGTNIKWLPPHALRNVSIGTMRLYENTITDIHPWAFHDVDNLRNLLILDNDITFLAVQIYVGLNHLIFLDLSKNRISLEIYKNCSVQDEADILPVLPQLRSLMLSSNPLKVIPMQMFAGLRESPLYTLYLDNCYITEIHPDAFSYVPTIETLNLSGNPPSLMGSLKSFLRPLENLQRLYLANTGFSSIPSSELEKVSNKLEVLDLSGNIIDRISDEDLSTFTQLKELYLDGAGILSISQNAFQANTNLRALSLKDNRLSQFEAILPVSMVYFNLSNSLSQLRSGGVITTSFQNLNRLRSMDISNMYLGDLTSETFTGLPELSQMFLNNCNISKIDEGAFDNLKKLKFLSLSRNPISALNFRVFRGLDSMHTLHLIDCSLRIPQTPTNLLSIKEEGEESEGSMTAFPHLPSLQTLDLSRNKIENLFPELFRNLPNLTYLTLSSNPLKSWSSRVFYREKSIFQFIASSSSIQFLREAMLQDFEPMSKIDLSFNNLVCDEGACSLRDMIKNSTYPDKEWVKAETYECFDVKTNSNYFILNLKDSICQAEVEDQPEVDEEPIYEKEKQTSSGHSKIILLSAALSAITITTLLTIFAYRSRVHLRYFMFHVKFNLMPVPQRKAKLSTMDDSEENAYDFDVFISYHNEDSKFVEEIFLPEIEMSDSSADNEGSLNEARNSIYFIDSDKNQIIKDDIKTNNKNKISFFKDKPKTNEKRFKVCLHERDFAAGVPITENIVDCTDRSRKTVIFVSKKYMQSQWCSFELNLTYHRLVERRRNAFLLVLMEEIPKELKSKVLNYLMVSKTYLQWPGIHASHEEKAVFWKRLRSFLEQ